MRRIKVLVRSKYARESAVICGARVLRMEAMMARVIRRYFATCMIVAHPAERSHKEKAESSCIVVGKQ